MSLSSSLEGRTLLGLLNGLNKRLFAADTSITNDFLAEQLYTGVDVDRTVIDAEIDSFEQLLRKLAEERWDASKLERLIKKTQLSPENQKIVCNFWQNEREKIHAKLVGKSRWNNGYNQLLWRVDMKATSKDVPDINEPLAVFEFVSTDPMKPEKATRDAVRFEMNRTQVTDMLSKLETIQKTIEEFSY